MPVSLPARTSSLTAAGQRNNRLELWSSPPGIKRYPVSERGRKPRSADFPVRSIVRTPTCTQFAARLCERSFLRTGKSALRPASLTDYTGYIKRRIFTLQLPQHGIGFLNPVQMIARFNQKI